MSREELVRRITHFGPNKWITDSMMPLMSHAS